MTVMIHEYIIRTQDSGPYGITRGKDGAMWFTEQRAIESGESMPQARSFRSPYLQRMPA